MSKTCTVRFDNNKHSVLATAVGRPVEVHAHAERIVIRQDGAVVGEHARAFGRGHTVFDPWHYGPVLARKPGALRSGAPFKDSVLPLGHGRAVRPAIVSPDRTRSRAIRASPTPRYGHASSWCGRSAGASSRILTNRLESQDESLAAFAQQSQDEALMQPYRRGKRRPGGIELCRNCLTTSTPMVRQTYASGLCRMDRQGPRGSCDGTATVIRRHDMKCLLYPLAVLAASPLLAATCQVPETSTREIVAAKLFIEDNTGDQDIGVHGYFDDHGWTELCVFNPSGALILHITPDGQMGDLGLSEVFFESQEPGYEDWNFADLKAAWPEGSYTVRAQSHDGEVLTGDALFTHNLPMPPVILSPALVPEPEDNPPTVPVGDITVTWEPVTRTQGGGPVTLRAYQLWVNKENHESSHRLASQRRRRNRDRRNGTGRKAG
jgi:hypothetical protein